MDQSFDLSRRSLDRRHFLAGLGTLSAAGLVLPQLQAAAWLAGAPTGASLAGKRVGIPAPIPENPFYVEQYKWFKKMASLGGYELVIVDGSRGKGSYNQLQNVQDAELMVEQGIDVLILDLADPCVWLDLVKNATGKGVGVWGNADSVLTGATQNQLQDNYTAGFPVGQAAGQWINDKMGGDASVGLVVRPDNPPLLDRSRGFTEGMRSISPNAKVVAQQKGMGTQEVSTAVANMYSAHPEITVWYVTSDVGEAIAALTPLSEAGVTSPDQAFVGSANPSPDALKIIAEHNTPLQATFAYSKNNFAAVEVMRQIEMWLQGQPVRPTQIAGGLVITQENAGQFVTYLNDLLAPGLDDVYNQVVQYTDEVQVTPKEKGCS
jgi:ribose transport system substrate-binding protein